MEMPKNLEKNCSKQPGSVVFYRCATCGVIFESKSQTLKHKADKHGCAIEKEANIHKTYTEPRNNDKSIPKNSNKVAPGVIVNLLETTADVVKIRHRNKGKLDNRSCKFCKEAITNNLSSLEITIEIFNEGTNACLSCYENIMKRPDAKIKPQRRNK